MAAGTEPASLPLLDRISAVSSASVERPPSGSGAPSTAGSSKSAGVSDIVAIFLAGSIRPQNSERKIKCSLPCRISTNRTEKWRFFWRSPTASELRDFHRDGVFHSLRRAQAAPQKRQAGEAQREQSR